MLFVVAYVDIFGLYRPDVRANIEAGEVGGFDIDQAFLVGTTAYVLIPSLMVFATLVLRPHVCRIANVALGVVRAHDRRQRGRRVDLLRRRQRHRARPARDDPYYAWTWPKRTVGRRHVDRHPPAAPRVGAIVGPAGREHQGDHGADGDDHDGDPSGGRQARHWSLRPPGASSSALSSSGGQPVRVHEQVVARRG